MGFASYLEDILDRLNEQLFVPVREIAARVETGSTQAQTSKDVARMLGLVVEAESLVREINANLELATDPQVDMAAELRRAETEIVRLQANVAAAKGHINLQEGKLRSASGETTKWKAKWEDEGRLRKQEEKRRVKAEDDIDYLVKSSPEAKLLIYERYGTPR